MYGRLAEVQEKTEASRQFLHGLVMQLRDGAVKPEQVELLEGGGFKVIPLPEPEDDAA